MNFLRQIIIGSIVLIPALCFPCQNSEFNRKNQNDYIFFSFLDTTVGGLQSFSTNIYLNRQGSIQISRESNNRKIYLLKTSIVNNDAIFHLAEKTLPYLNKKNNDVKSNIVTDYHPPQIAFIMHNSLYPLVKGRILKNDIPNDFKSILNELDTLLETKMHINEPLGIYIRAQYLPEFDTEIQKLDVVLNSKELLSYPWLDDAISQEMRLIKINNDKNIFSNVSKSLATHGVMTLKVNDMIYRITAINM